MKEAGRMEEGSPKVRKKRWKEVGRYDRRKEIQEEWKMESGRK